MRKIQVLFPISEWSGCVISSVIYESTGGPWVTALPLHNQPTYRRRILISLFLCVNTQNLPHILHPIHQVDSASSDYTSSYLLPPRLLSGLHVRTDLSKRIRLHPLN